MLQKFSDNYLNDRDSAAKIIWALSLLMICLSFYLVFLLYATNRSLWLDEAMLAFSFTERSFGDLAKGEFLWNQGPPILYLYTVKIITELFGYTEFTLRVFSLFSYILALFLAYKVLEKVFKIKYPIAGVAFLSSMTILLYYANEFKPYMTDLLSVLVILYLYYLYSEKYFNLNFLLLIFAIFPWLSYITIFFIGGVLSYEFIKNAIDKNIKKTINIAAGGLLIGLSFIVNYVVWIKPVAGNEFLIGFFLDYNFPLLPLSLSDI